MNNYSVIESQSNENERSTRPSQHRISSQAQLSNRQCIRAPPMEVIANGTHRNHISWTMNNSASGDELRIKCSPLAKIALTLTANLNLSNSIELLTTSKRTIRSMDYKHINRNQQAEAITRNIIQNPHKTKTYRREKYRYPHFSKKTRLRFRQAETGVHFPMLARSRARLFCSATHGDIRPNEIPSVASRDLDILEWCMAARIECHICETVDEIIKNAHGKENGQSLASCTLWTWPLVTGKWMDKTRA